MVDPGLPAALRRAGGQAQPTPAGAAAPASLGTVARFASPSLSAPSFSSPSVRRFSLQAAARELVPHERVALCLRRPIPAAAGVELLHVPSRGTAHYGGLQVCGSVWMCAVCSSKISERRREELSAGVKAWGGQIVLCTFTLQHKRSDELSGLLSDLLKAYRNTKNGKAWMGFLERFEVAGTVRALEPTHGWHGWHPHLHVLFFLGPGADVEAFTEQLRERWLACVAKVGRYASPQWGLDVRSANADIAAYVAKFGKQPKWTVAHEVAKAVSKRGRDGGLSPMQLLECYLLFSDDDAGAHWQEYAAAFKGKKQLVWSRGLRALLGLVVEEKTDQELVEEVVEEAVCLAVLDLAAWRVVLANDARGELLDVASSGDAGEVRRFLLALGVEVHDDG